MFLYQKTIDRSALRQGFQIPVEFHDLLKAMPGGMPRHGETRNIRLIVEGREYDAQLKNQDFDQTKYAGPVLFPLISNVQILLRIRGCIALILSCP